MNARAPQGNNVVTQSLAQIGACGLFLLTLLGRSRAASATCAKRSANCGSSAP